MHFFSLCKAWVFFLKVRCPLLKDFGLFSCRWSLSLNMCVICIHVLVSQFVKAQILFYFCFISIMENNVEADTCILVYFCSEKSENIKLNKTQIIENQALSAQSRTRAKGACFNEEPSINMFWKQTR